MACGCIKDKALVAAKLEKKMARKAKFLESKFNPYPELPEPKVVKWVDRKITPQSTANPFKTTGTGASS